MPVVVRSITVRPSAGGLIGIPRRLCRRAALRATSWAVALIFCGRRSHPVHRRYCCSMPALVWAAMADDWSAVLRASWTERVPSAMIGCSLSRKRLNQPANCHQLILLVTGQAAGQGHLRHWRCPRAWALRRESAGLRYGHHHTSSKPISAARILRPSSVSVPAVLRCHPFVF